MLVFIYTATIFVSATLLFLIQPMFARLVLPLLGGSPAVWNTALVFFQAALLAGYAYAHFSTRWLGVKRQSLMHGVLLLLPLLVLPIGLPAAWKPPAQGSPVPSLLLLLSGAVGLPFFVVSASSPLLQRWFAATRHRTAHNPYFLYAASNCGSMLALLCYPLLVEPNLRLGEQMRLWTIGYCLLVALGLCCIALLWREARGEAGHANHAPPENVLPENIAPPHSPASNAQTPGTHTANAHAQKLESSGMSTHGAGEDEDSGMREDGAGAKARRRARWVMLAFVPSSLMMSVTAYLSSDIAAIPLLWVIPLAIYLLTFILVFAARPLSQAVIARAVPLVMLPLVIVVTRASQPIELLIPLHLLNFFLIAMMCHGELARDRPPTQHLTEFYLWMSFGGVLGGAFNALLAPLVFDTLVEYPLVLALSCLFLPFPVEKNPGSHARLLDFAWPASIGLLTLALILGLQGKLQPGPLTTTLLFGVPALVCFGFSRRPLRFALGVAAILWAGTFYLNGEGRVLFAGRSFFGLHRVTLDRSGDYNFIVHGGIVHGMQSRDAKRHHVALAYYYPSGPAGQVFAKMSGARTPRNVAIVGLGAGALAAYARRGQNWTFYEIDPVVERIARDPRLFTYLRDSPAATRVVLGDGRLSLQNARDAHYDLLILDAYSSDALPVHLMTRQALRVYLSRLAPGGLLVFNVSNLHLNLEPVLANLARDAALPCLFRNDRVLSEREKRLGKSASNWMIMARDIRDLEPFARDTRWRRARTDPRLALWTDDYSSLLSIFLWSGNNSPG